MKTAEEILSDKGINHNTCDNIFVKLAIESCKIYANQKLDEASVKAEISWIDIYNAEVDKYSILSLKDE